MIIKKVKENRITVYVADSDTHARKITYSKEVDDKGKYIYLHEQDLSCTVVDPKTGERMEEIGGKTPIEAKLKNKVKKEGYTEITAEEFEATFAKPE